MRRLDTYSTGRVAIMIGITASRISYAQDRGQIPGVRPRKRKNLRYFFTVEEIVAMCDYFDVPVPEELRATTMA